MIQLFPVTFGPPNLDVSLDPVPAALIGIEGNGTAYVAKTVGALRWPGSCPSLVSQVSSAAPSPPNSAASCRAARSKAGEGRCPLRPPPRTSRRRNCRAAARTRRASASSDSTAASSSSSAGDSLAAVPVMPFSAVAEPSCGGGVLSTGPAGCGRVARAFGALGLGTAPNKSGCLPSAAGPCVMRGFLAPYRIAANGNRLRPLPQLGPSASRAGFADFRALRLAASRGHPRAAHQVEPEPRRYAAAYLTRAPGLNLRPLG